MLPVPSANEINAFLKRPRLSAVCVHPDKLTPGRCAVHLAPLRRAHPRRPQRVAPLPPLSRKEAANCCKLRRNALNYMTDIAPLPHGVAPPPRTQSQPQTDRLVSRPATVWKACHFINHCIASLTTLRGEKLFARRSREMNGRLESIRASFDAARGARASQAGVAATPPQRDEDV